MKRRKIDSACVSRPRWSFTFRRNDNDELPCTRMGSPTYSHEVTSYAADEQFADALGSARERAAR